MECKIIENERDLIEHFTVLVDNKGVPYEYSNKEEFFMRRFNYKISINFYKFLIENNIKLNVLNKFNSGDLVKFNNSNSFYG